MLQRIVDKYPQSEEAAKARDSWSAGSSNSVGQPPRAGRRDTSHETMKRCMAIVALAGPRDAGAARRVGTGGGTPGYETYVVRPRRHALEHRRARLRRRQALARDPQGEPPGHQREPHLSRGRASRPMPAAAARRRRRGPRGAGRQRTRQKPPRRRQRTGGRRGRSGAGRPASRRRAEPASCRWRRPSCPSTIVRPALYRSAGYIADSLPAIAIVASEDERLLIATGDAAIVNAPVAPAAPLHRGSRRPPRFPPEDRACTSAG